jgi:hypothetical protein
MFRAQSYPPKYHEAKPMDHRGASWLFFGPSPILLRLLEEHMYSLQTQTLAPFLINDAFTYEKVRDACLFRTALKIQPAFKGDVSNVTYEESRNRIRKLPGRGANALSVWVCQSNEEAQDVRDLFFEQFKKHNLQVIMIRKREDDKMWTESFSHAPLEDNGDEDYNRPPHAVDPNAMHGKDGWKTHLKTLRGYTYQHGHWREPINPTKQVVICTESIVKVVIDDDIWAACDQWYMLIPKPLKWDPTGSMWTKCMNQYRHWFKREGGSWQSKTRHFYIVTMPKRNKETALVDAD